MHSLVAKGWTLDLRSAAARERTRAPAASPAWRRRPAPGGRGARGASRGGGLPRSFWALAAALQRNLGRNRPQGRRAAPRAVRDRARSLARGDQGRGPRRAGKGSSSSRSAAPPRSFPSRIWPAAGASPWRSTLRGRSTASRSPGTWPRRASPCCKTCSLSALATVDPRTKAESYALDLGRGGRPWRRSMPVFPPRTAAAGRDLDARCARRRLGDVSAGSAAPGFTAAGEGSVAADAAFGQLRASGRLRGVVSKLGVLAPGLERLGTQEVETRFALTQAGRTLRVEALSVALGGARPIATVQSLQPFEVDLRTGDLNWATVAGIFCRPPCMPCRWPGSPA